MSNETNPQAESPTQLTSKSVDLITAYNQAQGIPAPLAQPLDLTRPVRTKGSKHSVRIICTEPGFRFPIVGIIEGQMEYDTWTAEGWYYNGWDSAGLDLENVPTEGGAL